MSAYVGASTFRTTGVPCEVIATVPVPVNVVLKTPPAIIDAPSTRLMSHVSEESKARTLLPLTVSALAVEVDQVDLHGVVGQEDVHRDR